MSCARRFLPDSVAYEEKEDLLYTASPDEIWDNVHLLDGKQAHDIVQKYHNPFTKSYFTRFLEFLFGNA